MIFLRNKNPVTAKIPTEFELTAVQVLPRSSILVPIKGQKVHTQRSISHSLIVTLDVSRIIFETLTQKARKQLILLTPPCLTPLPGRTR